MNFAIILAAGKSKRMGKNVKKEFLSLLGRPILYHSLKIFNNCRIIDDILVVTQKIHTQKIFHIKTFFGFNKIKKIVVGGKKRQNSVYNGLTSIKNAKNDDIIVVHNASNPLVKEEEVIACINNAKKYGASACAFPVKDTIKKVRNNFIEKTIDRNELWHMQTPQAIAYGIFIKAFENAINKKIKLTDDVALVEAIGKKVKITECSYENIKITAPDDLVIAEGILTMRNKKNFLKENFFLIGIGQDSHKFSLNKNKGLILGGYKISNETGLEANSDGDLILHALFNATSSAIGQKSLGYYSEPMFKKGVIDSKEYLKVVLNELTKRNLKLGNVSIAIEAKKPNLEKHTDKIKYSLSKILNLDKENIGITYTSGEGLTAFGRGEGMQCFVVVTLYNNNTKIFI